MSEAEKIYNEFRKLSPYPDSFEVGRVVAYCVEAAEKLEKESADFKKRNSNMNHGMARDLQKIAKLEKENAELRKELEAVKNGL